MKPLKYWKDTSFEISTYQFRLVDRMNKTYRTSGTDNTQLCEYTYNELGYRGDSIKKEGFKVMSIGCSYTEGVGVNNDETWSSFFCSLIPNAVNMNFGTGGRSSDYVVRCLLSYYDLIKPNLVLIMYPHPFRREFYTKDNNIEPFMPTASWSFMKETEEGRKIQENLVELQNENEDFINWYKNHLLIKYFLKDKKCNWLWNGFRSIPIDYKESNRFDGDYGNFIDLGTDGGHPGPKHNKMYADKLYDFISKKFPSYVDNITKNKQSLI